MSREGSVCIYVVPGEASLPSPTKIKSQEYGFMKRNTFGDSIYSANRSGFADGIKTDYGGFIGEIRIWWD